MNGFQLNLAIKKYKKTLKILQETKDPSSKQILDTLCARDEVQQALDKKDSVKPVVLMVIDRFDSQLEEQSALITQTLNLEHFRKLSNPSKQAWWWFLSPPTQRSHRWDFLWEGLTMILLVVNVHWIVQIASRFVSGDPVAIETFSAIVQSLLTIFVAGAPLTKLGREIIDKILDRFNVEKHLWHKAKFALAVAVSALLILLSVLLPKFSTFYNQQGLASYNNDDLSTARSHFELAIKLNPDYEAAHFNLGLVYEDLLNFKSARTQYEIAIAGGLDKAYNNLARLYVRDKKYDLAVSLLLKGLQRINPDNNDADSVRYHLLKNLGWATLKQKRYPYAAAQLRAAIEIDDEKAPAHCLLAQVHDKQGQTEQALAEWETCLRLASSQKPDEDAWIAEARKILAKRGDKK